MFSDPYCPACKQFEAHSRAVWCSADRGKAWLDLVLRGKLPAASAGCKTPVEKNLELGRALRVNATPTLILGNGERHAGGMPLDELTRRLDAAR